MKLNEIAAPVEKHTVLNPKLWEHDRLKSDVRGALLRIAEDFIKFVEVPVDVEDIVIYGGNVNYNYTAHSDIDLHLVVDYSTVECERTIDELFDSKRKLYKEKYNIQVHGIPVELYVEDINETPVSSSYSVLRGEWIKKPSLDMPEWDHKKVAHMVAVWQVIIQHAIRTADLKTCRQTMELLRKYRKAGLATPDAEFSVPNLVFKSLRNDDAIKGIQTIIDRLHDRDLSLGY
jgi:hypothetical protein